MTVEVHRESITKAGGGEFHFEFCPTGQPADEAGSDALTGAREAILIEQVNHARVPGVSPARDVLNSEPSVGDDPRHAYPNPSTPHPLLPEVSETRAVLGLALAQCRLRVGFGHPIERVGSVPTRGVALNCTGVRNALFLRLWQSTERCRWCFKSKDCELAAKL